MVLVRFLLALLAAVFLQTLALWMLPATWWIVDPFLLLVVIWSLGISPGVSLAVGTTTGWVQDALTGGFYGLHGFANTSTAWIIAQLRQRFVIQQPLQLSLLFALAAILQKLQIALLSYFVLSGAEMLSPGKLITIAIANGILGPILLGVMEQIRSTYQEWSRRRQQRLGIDIA